MRPTVLLALALLLPSLAPAAPLEGPPEGFTLVAEDDCGDLDAQPHVVRGTEYVFHPPRVTGALSERTIVFDDDFCVLKYEKLDPEASYKVDVVYVTEAPDSRQQSLEANGHVVHEALTLPHETPGRFIFDLPQAAYADAKPVELTFTKRGGANAVVSYVRIWSTDPTPLPAKNAFWLPRGPVEKDWLRQDRLRGRPRFGEWEDPEKEVQENVLPCIDEQLDRGRSILADLKRMDAKGVDESRVELAAAAGKRRELLRTGSLDPEAWLEAYRAARWAVRRLAFKNPLLETGDLLFVRRHHAHAMHQCSRRLGTFTNPGGDICILTDLTADGEPTVTSLTGDRFPSGTFTRADLSFDGERVVFGFAAERDPEAKAKALSYGPLSEQTAAVYAEHKGGLCEEFQVWELPLDGDAAPRKLTEGPSENSDPLYLPDGRIAFMSHRPGGLVQCGDWALAYCVFTMEADGSNPIQITRSKDGEWDPFLLHDGRIGFTRWEYVMKFWSPIQMVWSVRPDGTDPRLIYGSDLSKQYAYPLNYASAQQIPGTSKLACIGSAHHNTGAGPLCIVDLAKGTNEAEGLARVTPVRFVETPDEQPHAGWYDCPYPLSENYFLLSYSFSTSEADTTGYGLYLFDMYGGKELIYRDEELSALFPVPLRPRPRTPELPPLTHDGPGDYGELVIQNVHEGLDPSAAGQAKYVQVVECHERHIHTSPYAMQVGPDSGFETKTVLGTAPVEADGSAYFRVPAGKSIFFNVLDKDYRALHTMRSVTNVQAGERLSCVGCHEGSQRVVPANRVTLAAQRKPSDLEPPAWGVRPMEFASVVQPVLDRHCISCHDGAVGDKKSFDLTANSTRPYMGVPLPVSYYNLRPHVKHAGIYEYFKPAGSFGSGVSPVMELLKQGHYDVALDRGEWHTLCAWIDCNVPGIGDYGVADVSRRQERLQDERDRLAELRNDAVDRRKLLADSLPTGKHLAGYLDCGIEGASGTDDGVRIREVAGAPFAYGAGADVTDAWYDDIAFDGAAVVFEVEGLAEGKRYQLGFSWWDHNNSARIQAVTLRAGDGQSRQLLPPTLLPAWVDKQQRPEERVIDLPADLPLTGKLTISFSNHSKESNAVVSEVWLVESP